MELTFRFAEERDTPLILDFIKWLADYEQLLDQVVADEATLTDQLFRKKNAEVLFALEDGKEVGFALFFHNFSTFLGRSGLYLEDLFVLPEHRGKGYGKAILQKLAAIALERGCGRMEWWCLDWNKPSIDFYRSLGAEPMSDWTVYRLTGETLNSLAETPETCKARCLTCKNWRSNFTSTAPPAMWAGTASCPGTRGGSLPSRPCLTMPGRWLTTGSTTSGRAICWEKK